MADMNERENDNAMIDEIKAVGGCCFAWGGGRRKKFQTTMKCPVSGSEKL